MVWDLVGLVWNAIDEARGQVFWVSGVHTEINDG